MIGGNTTGRNNDGWVMALVISQLFLNRMIMARSTEVFDRLRARADAESLTETASEFTSISIINLATEPLQPAAVTGMTAGTSQDVSPTNIEQATDTGTIARDTPPSTQVAVTSAFASQAAAASQGGMDIPELSVGTDGILHWQQPALIASQQSEASGAAETSVEMSNAAPVASLPATLAVESIARVQPSVISEAAKLPTTSAPQIRTTVVIVATDPNSGSETSAVSISDVQLSYSASQTLVDEGSVTSQVASEAVLGSTASSSLARIAISVASRSALLDFSDVSITSRIGASASSSGSASHLASASSVNNGGVIAVEDDNESSTASFKSTTAPTIKTSASDYKLTGPSSTTAESSESIDESLVAASSSTTTPTSIDDTVFSIPSDTTIVSDGITLTGQDAVAALAAEKTSTASASATTMTTSESSGLSSIAIVGIVGGVLVALIVIYLIWYQWRKKRARKALGEETPDDPDFLDEKYPDRLTRSSFGADEPITPAVYKRRRTDHNDDEAPTDYEGEYDYDDDGRTIAGDMIALDGRTEYGLTQYGDGMTAVLADGMATNVLPTSRTVQTGQGDNPFVPVPPVPRLPSVYTSPKSITLRAADDNLSQTATHTQVPHDRETGYGMSIYDAYGGPDSRPQTQFSEPSTSNLLPWLNKGSQTPTPSVPPVDPQYTNNQVAGGPSHTPSRPPRPNGRNEVGDQQMTGMPMRMPMPMQIQMDEHEPMRAPPRAVMAQTPLPVGPPTKFESELDRAPIPTFR
ncbi:hypothetical protein, variant 2 [Cryptococcus neoformans var. grubii H99]|uniref:Uncharacterized protein n=1 Tax=Cryptococcus neoformans (strain H99 / ATCC 208821 / CBS 10515 / FGSC 9487) TaxID=235443 RepID=T2BP96_CRYN9|nr:hypothetical protein, variant 2 [Cryptococcus neoformans var. grubii H99]AGV14526.1 hypothetical protein, variant 2 [Cryptococcus neoformans var. grubii H99]AUB26303.1 hypothetical protein CKF44_03163 [Cryptococcus neoformans var. grubii]|eukprot:XP_012051067.1 hypothetical protein, variant 2 [Cryptococcus neoformans var. grubii H99]